MVLREILHSHIPYLHQESTLQDAIDKMDIYQFPALVIIDNDSKPLAVITEGDVCRAIQNSTDLKKKQSDFAIDHSTHNPYCTNANTTIEDAFGMMLDRQITLLPIVEDEKLLGIVLRIDLLQAMLCKPVN